MRGHYLKIRSLYDAQAECTCGGNEHISITAIVEKRKDIARALETYTSALQALKLLTRQALEKREVI